MARTELPNGVILPAEYSDDWYEDMTSNLTKLDDVIGSDSEKLNADGVYFLRMSSAALTDSGTGNFSDLNSSYKIKTGDLVLDSGRKLYRIVSVDSTNETFTVGNSLFKVTAESDLAPVAESGDYGDLDNRPDLNPYDQHLANTDIHVTAADKQKWNNGVTQAYVLRYSSTAITDNSTIAYSTLDNTDNIKADDKIIDVDGKIFSIVSVDSDNSTVTVGTALIDLALDGNVVHKSGDETVGGKKTFTETPYIYNSDSTGNAPNIVFKNSKYAKGDTTNTGEQRLIFSDSSNTYVGQISSNKNISGTQYLSFTIYTTDNNNANLSSTINYYLVKNGDRYFTSYEDSLINLGASNRRWKSVYATNYYYGSNNVEFSTKFVTTDTNQTISGNKTFSDNLTIYNSDNTVTPKGLTIRNAQWGMGESGGTTVSNINFLDKNSAIPASVMASKGIYGQSFLRFSVRTKDSQNNTYAEEIYYDIDTSGNVEFRSWHDNTISLGTSASRWKDLYTNKVNGLEPSSLSLPSGNVSDVIDISGYLTYLDGTINTYTAPANGWISITVNNCSEMQAYITGFWGHQVVRPTVGDVRFLMPVLKNQTVHILIFNGSIDNARFIPCQGNV